MTDPILNSVPAPATRSAADLADDLVALLRRREPALQAVVEARLRILEDLLEADPWYAPAEMLYLRNRLASCRLLNELAEWNTAAYQMRELARKLRRWQGGDTGGLLAPVFDPTPRTPAVVALAEPRTPADADAAR